MRALRPFAFVMAGAAGAACSSFSPAAPVAPDAEAGTDASIDVSVPDGAPMDGGHGEEEAGPVDAGPLPTCGAGTKLSFFEPFATKALTADWVTSYPQSSGPPLPGLLAFPPATAATSPPFVLRLQRTGNYGIAVARAVDTKIATMFEVHFKARIDPGELTLFRLTTDADATLFEVKTSTISNVLFLEEPSGSRSQLPIPPAWSLFTLVLDKTQNRATLTLSGVSTPASVLSTLPITDTVKITLLSFSVAPPAVAFAMPTVDFDDLLFCTGGN